MKCKLIALAFIMLCSRQLFAHALWIETNSAGIKGRPQVVNIFFGEYADKDITPADKWFSDLKDFSLIVITPDKQSVVLKATAATNRYTAVFTPAVAGVYTILLHHVVRDVYGSMKLDYNSSAAVLVGTASDGNSAHANTNCISLFAESAFHAKKNLGLQLLALHNHAVAVTLPVKVFAPNGWGKELYTNDKGEVSFTPLWPGKYMAEFAYTEKTAGEHNGKSYQEVWKVATYMINVQ